MLRFIISHMITGHEIAVLERLASDEPFRYRRKIAFDQEMRHLRDLGFVEGLSGRSSRVSLLPQAGADLREHFQITERGLQYLRLRSETGDEGPSGS